MVLVEINSSSGAFIFKTFDSEQQAKVFCERLPKLCKTLRAFIVDILPEKTKKQ